MEYVYGRGSVEVGIEHTEEGKEQVDWNDGRRWEKYVCILFLSPHSYTHLLPFPPHPLPHLLDPHFHFISLFFPPVPCISLRLYTSLLFFPSLIPLCLTCTSNFCHPHSSANHTPSHVSTYHLPGFDPLPPTTPSV